VVTSLRTVIVDDELLARQALSRILAEFPEVKICGQADSIAQADALVRDVRADVVYLDIELFGESGFDLVPLLDEHVAIVFVTGHDHYATRAFEVNALDYLLKPVTRERLAKTIRRLSDQSSPQPPSPDLGRLRFDDVILVQDGKRRRWQPLNRVCMIEAEGDFSVLRSTDGFKGIVWRRINEWERILPAEQFVRIHRGRIVNLEHVKWFETVPGNRLRLHIEGVLQPCHASRSRTKFLRQHLKAGR